MEEITDAFSYLENLVPSEWANIPQPLLMSIVCMKKCILQTNLTQNATNNKFAKFTLNYDRKFEDIESRVKHLNSKVLDIDESTKNKINDLSDGINQDIAIFKSMISKDLDFKQRSADTKLLTMQEQFFAMKKLVSSLPFMQEIQNTIKDSNSELRTLLKKEVTEYIVNPEVVSINKRIDSVNENNEIYISKFQELLEVLRNSIQVLEHQHSEGFISYERMLSSAIADKQAKLEEFQLKIEQIVSDISASNLRYEALSKLFNQASQVSSKAYKDIEHQIVLIKDEMKTLDDLNTELETATKKISELEAIILNRGVNERDFKDQEIKAAEIKPTKKRQKKKKKTDSKIEKINVEGDEKEVEVTAIEVEKPLQILKTEELKSVDSGAIDPGLKISFNDIPSKSITSESVIKSSSIGFGEYANGFSNKDSTVELEKLVKLTKRLKVLQETLKELQKNSKLIEKRLADDKNATYSHIKDIETKLSWLPISFHQLKGKSPNEARLFTLEARLRMEENLRVEQFNQLVSAINQLRTETGNSNTGVFPQIATGRQTARVLERKPSIESIENSEILRRTLNGNDKSTDSPAKPTKNRANTRKFSVDTERTPKTNHFFKNL